jgi:hypothetical protein
VLHKVLSFRRFCRQFGRFLQIVAANLLFLSGIKIFARSVIGDDAQEQRAPEGA